MRGRHNAEVGMTQVVPTSAQPGLHARLREDQGRAVRATALHHHEKDEGQAAPGQG